MEETELPALTMFGKLKTSTTEKAAEAPPGAVSKDDVETGQIESLDEAELFLQEHGITNAQLQEMLNDPEKSNRLRRRVDRILLPLLCGTYCLQYIDKQVPLSLVGSLAPLIRQALSYSAVFDLFTDANITSDQYSWLASLFYFGMCPLPSYRSSKLTV